MSATEEQAIRVIVVDDELPARAFVRSVLSELSFVRLVAECPDGPSAVEAIRREAPDLVLLDVQMPEVDGFDVIEAVGADVMPEVVFVTAHEEYTLQAFAVHAVDYILKPVAPERLREAVRLVRDRMATATDDSLDQRLRELLAEIKSHDATHSGQWVRRLTVRDGDRIRFVRLTDVDWIEAARNYVRLYVGTERHVVRISLRALVRRLDPAQFIRIHRSAVVNLDRVREVQAWAGGEYVAVLANGQKLRVSRGYRDGLLALMH